MSDLERLLAASIESVRQSQRIRELESEKALLQAQLRLANLKLERRLAASAHLPALLRPQV